MSEVEHVLAIDNDLGEGAVWNVEEQCIYWVDIPKGRFFRLQPDTGKYESFDIGMSLGVLRFRASGGLIMGTKQGMAFWDFKTQTLKHVAEPEGEDPNSRINDGATDRQGRFWGGTIVTGKADGSLYRLDTNLSVHKMETGISCSNGIDWSLDNKTMYYTDSTACAIYAYDFDPATGEIANRRICVHTPEDEGVPDGMTLDSEGFIWSARWNGSKVSRYDPEGKLEREISLPVPFITSCAFGGKNLDELYITTAKTEEIKKDYPWAGDLFRVQTGIKGLPSPKFLG